MASVFHRLIVRPVAWLFKAAESVLTRFAARKVKRQWMAEVTDDFIGFLLKAMAFSFKVKAVCFSLGLLKEEDFQSHLQDSRENYFDGRYLFRTEEKPQIVAAATFKDGRMYYHDNDIPQWDVRVTFTSGEALRRFLFSENQDIINSLAENEVKVEGNLNHIYKFGFMAKDLLRQINLAFGDA